MNGVFGIPLLLNILTSSVMVCFVGFQMTMGLSADHIIKLALFLFSAVSEIYLICYFSDLLIVSVRGLFCWEIFLVYLSFFSERGCLYCSL